MGKGSRILQVRLKMLKKGIKRSAFSAHFSRIFPSNQEKRLQIFATTAPPRAAGCEGLLTSAIPPIPALRSQEQIPRCPCPMHFRP
jgi:hypothetical protein